MGFDAEEAAAAASGDGSDPMEVDSAGVNMAINSDKFPAGNAVPHQRRPLGRCTLG